MPAFTLRRILAASTLSGLAALTACVPTYPTVEIPVEAPPETPVPETPAPETTPPPTTPPPTTPPVISDPQTPPPPPSPPTTPPPEPGVGPEALRAGSAPIGSTSYDPAGGLFVSPMGNDQNPGTLEAPWRTVGRAVSAAPAGSKIVLRGGIYREMVEIPPTKRLTVQPYPNEAVWFDGSVEVTDWVSDGNAWRKDGWTAKFSRSGLNGTLVDPANPTSIYLDMAFLDGTPLRQVLSRSQVAPGTFFVDESRNQLFVGSNPAGRRVEATILPEALNIKSAGSVLRGIGFRRYATQISRHGAVKANAPGVVVENSMFEHNATGGLYVTAPDVSVRRVTAVGNGQVGVFVDSSDRFTLDDSRLVDNNFERFNPASAAGGVKVFESHAPTIRTNLADDNYGHGIWLDTDVDGATVLRNVTRRNFNGAGIMFEMSSGVVIAGNVSTDNTVGILGGESSNMDVWNNTLVNNEYALKVYDGWRAPRPTGFTVRNNIISSRQASTRPTVIAEDVTKGRTWSQMGWTSDSNAYYRRSTVTTPYASSLASGTTGRVHFKTVPDVITATGQERYSMGVDNAATDPYVANAAAGDYGLPAGSPAIGRGAPLPSHVASALGVPTGTVPNIGAV